MQGKGRLYGFGARTRVPCWQVVCILSLLLVGVSISANTNSGVEIQEISIRRVELQMDGAPENLDDSIVLVGDQLHVRAVVANTSSETKNRLRVDFFFTEILTNEHGLLGSQTVFSLAPGEQRLPAISVPTAGLTPGRYIITAAVAEQGASDYLDSFTTSTDEDYVIKVNGVGPGIAELGLNEVTSAFRASQFGGLDDSISIKLHNVGTTSFSSITIGFPFALPCSESPLSVSDSTSPDRAFLRFSDASNGIMDLQVVAKLGENKSIDLPIKTLTLGGSAPGDTMRLIVSYCTDPLDTYYQPEDAAMAQFEVLGHPAAMAEPLSVELSVRPGELIDGQISSGTTRKLILPSEDTEATVYSELDLWQFPLPDEPDSIGVPTMMPAVRPAAPSKDYLFHVTQHVQEDQTTTYRLHALNPEDGSAYASLDFDAAPLTDVAVFQEPADGAFQYRVYMGTADGAVEAFTLTVDKSDTTRAPIYTWEKGNGASTATEWQAVTDTVEVISTAVPATFLELGQVLRGGENELSSVLVVSGPAGIYVLDVYSGALLNGIPSSGVTTRPVVVDGYVWYAQGSTIHSAPLLESPDAVEYCSPDAGRTITTPLVHESGALFWGTANGGVGAYIIGSDCDVTAGRRDVSQLGDIVGIAVGTDVQDRGDPILFVTGRSGGIASYEFDLSDSYPSFQSIAEETGLELNGDEEPHSLPASKSTTLRTQILAPIGAPTILDVDEPRETVFVVAQFEGQTGVSNPTNHWALVALNGATFVPRTAETWGKTVSYVLKMEESIDLLLEPIVVPPLSADKHVLIVVVPGERLYALNVGRFIE